MRIHSYLALVCCALLVVLALGVTTQASSGDHTPANMTAPSATSDSPADEVAPADQCDLPAESIESLDTATDQGEGYECPKGIPYCQRDSQCADYCGPGGFEVCSFGCCACAG